jgi:peptidoglycan/LPS O-acetylase OafA/YrhL
MAVDADFYLLLPLVALAVLALARRVPPARRAALLFALCGAAVIASIVLRAVISAAYPLAVTDQVSNFTLLRNVFGMGSVFVTGIVLALLTVIKIKVRPGMAYVVLAAGLATGIGLFFVSPNTLASAIFSDLVGGLSIGLLLFACLHGAIPGADKVVRSKLVVSISALAYAIYLFHWPVLYTLYNLIGGHHHRAHPTVIYNIELSIALAAGTFIVAYLAHHFIEQPFLRRKDKLRESTP